MLHLKPDDQKSTVELSFDEFAERFSFAPYFFKLKLDEAFDSSCQPPELEFALRKRKGIFLKHQRKFADRWAGDPSHNAESAVRFGNQSLKTFGLFEIVQVGQNRLC